MMIRNMRPRWPMDGIQFEFNLEGVDIFCELIAKVVV
jgi:hypothetical protein